MLGLLGASAVVLTAGGGAFVLTRDPAGARVPWSVAGERFEDPRLRAVSYAIFAPNPHNRQPWIVDLRTEGEVHLFCDTDGLLPETDTFGRQIVIGLGCFLELLKIAAEADGYAVEVDGFPEGASEERLDKRPVAHVRFTKKAGIPMDPLFHAILRRRSNKEPYDTDRAVPASVLMAVTAEGRDNVSSGATANPDDVSRLRDLTWRAHVTEVTTPRMNMESLRLMRIGKSKIEANPDGIALGGAFLETLNRIGVLTREELADQESSAFHQGLEMYREITGTAMAYVWVITEGNTRRDQLAAGRAWVRMNLKAAEIGVGLHPLSQSLQEYEEVQPHFWEVHAMLTKRPGQRIQMLGRVGYGPDVAPSPRWPVETRLLEA